MQPDIVSAWTFVRGAELCFEALAPGLTLMVGNAVALSLPLRVQSQNRAVVVGFLIRQEEAVKVARNMFAQPDGDISPEDLRDAGLEACNVLAGSVVAACEDPASVEIGLPQALALEDYLDIARRATVRACYVGKPYLADDDVRVVMTVFDLPQMHQPRADV
jgi:hypothetical protein